MNRPHLNPNESFVHPQNVTGIGTLSGIWQNAPQSHQEKRISRYADTLVNVRRGSLAQLCWKAKPMPVLGCLIQNGNFSPLFKKKKY